MYVYKAINKISKHFVPFDYRLLKRYNNTLTLYFYCVQFCTLHLSVTQGTLFSGDIIYKYSELVINPSVIIYNNRNLGISWTSLIVVNRDKAVLSPGNESTYSLCTALFLTISM
jgi:hypothetical protein